MLEESRKGNENTRAISVSFDLCTIFETQDKTVKKDRITVFSGSFFPTELFLSHGISGINPSRSSLDHGDPEIS